MKGASKLLALLLVVFLAPGCGTFKKVGGAIIPGGGPPKWCSDEQQTFAWTKQKTYDPLAAYAAEHPDFAETWAELRSELEAEQARIDRECAEPNASTGSIGEFITKAAALIDDALAIVAAVKGSRGLGDDGDELVKHRARMSRLVLEIEKTTGQRAIVGSRSRALGRR